MIARNLVVVVLDPAKMTVEKLTIISILLILGWSGVFAEVHLEYISD